MATKKVTTKTKTEMTEPAAPETAFPFEPLNEKWLASLNQSPVVYPGFAGTLAMRADQIVYDWLRENGPAEIFALYCAASSLNLFEDEWEASHGFVSEDGNSSILKVIAECVSALAKAGDGWTNSTP